MRISNVTHVEVIRTMEGDLLIRAVVFDENARRGGGGPETTTLAITLSGTMDVDYMDLRPWHGGIKRVK